MPSPDDYKLLHHKSHSPGSWRGALFLSSAPPVPNRCGKTWQRPSCNCPKMLLPTFTLPAHLTPVIPLRCLTGICRSHWAMGVCSTPSIFRIFLHIFD